MAPVNTMSPRNLSDDLRRDLETYSDDIQDTTEAVFRESDKHGELESSTSSISRGVVTSETAMGEEISPRDLFSSDRAYQSAMAAAQEQLKLRTEALERTEQLKNLGHRIASFRDSF